MPKITLLFLTTLLLAGCGATFTAKDCTTANWTEMGVNDFKSGKKNSEIKNYKSTCQLSETDTRLVQYEQGYQQGIEKYCTYDFGYKRGRQGAAELSCPNGSEYYVGFDRGREELMEERNKRQLKSLESQTGQDVSGIPGPVAP